jgi:hypothetical protein
MAAATKHGRNDVKENSFRGCDIVTNNEIGKELTDKFVQGTRERQSALIARLTAEFGPDQSKWPHARELRERDEKEKQNG